MTEYHFPNEPPFRMQSKSSWHLSLYLHTRHQNLSFLASSRWCKCITRKLHQLVLQPAAANNPPHRHRLAFSSAGAGQCRAIFVKWGQYTPAWCRFVFACTKRTQHNGCDGRIAEKCTVIAHWLICWSRLRLHFLSKQESLTLSYCPWKLQWIFKGYRKQNVQKLQK